MGERPAILSRGYATAAPDDGVVDRARRDGMRADLDRAGDEPLMLARQLPGVSVLCCSDRYLAGRLAEHASRRDGARARRRLPASAARSRRRSRDRRRRGSRRRCADAAGGRLREPPDALLAADAVLATDDAVLARGPAPRHSPFEVFKMRRLMGAPRSVRRSGRQAARVLADRRHRASRRFLRRTCARRVAIWPGRGPFAITTAIRRRDLDRMFQEARAAGADRVLTTEKDFVRLLPFRPFPLAVGWVPLTMEPDSLPEFRRWLAGALAGARDLWPDPVD